jgi:hypothetical protein
MGHDVGGCDQVDVVTADLLKPEHQLCQVFILDSLPLSLMGNRPVLAEDAAKIAVGKEYRARAMFTDKGDLFSKMGLGTGNHNPVRSAAKPLFSFEPLDTTLPWAKSTFLQYGIGLINPLGQLSLVLQILVGRMPGLSILRAVNRDGRNEEGTTEDERILKELSTSYLHLLTLPDKSGIYCSIY